MAESQELHHGYPHIMLALIVTMFIVAIYAAAVGPHTAEADESSEIIDP